MLKTQPFLPAHHLKRGRSRTRRPSQPTYGGEHDRFLNPWLAPASPRRFPGGGVGPVSPHHPPTRPPLPRVPERAAHADQPDLQLPHYGPPQTPTHGPDPQPGPPGQRQSLRRGVCVTPPPRPPLPGAVTSEPGETAENGPKGGNGARLPPRPLPSGPP